MNNWLKYWCSSTFSGTRGVKAWLMTVATDFVLFWCPLSNGLVTELTKCFPVFESFKIQHIAIFTSGFVVQRILWLVCTANCIMPILSAICGGHGVSSWIDRWSDGRLIEILVLIIIFWKRGECRPGLWGWPQIVRCFGALFPMVLSRCDKNKWPGPLISFSSSWKNKMHVQAMIWQWCTALSTAAPLTRTS